MEKSRVEWILRYGLGEVSTLPPRLSRIEKLLAELIRKSSEGDITVDDELSPTSENPVQNKVLNSIINGTGSGSVHSKIMLAIAEVVAEAPEDFDTLKEISDWISHHEDSAAAMNSAIQANTTAIAGKVDKVSGKGLSTNDYTTEEKTKLSEIESGANKTVVDSALNSSSTNPVQNRAIKESLDNKVDKVSGKGLSTNDYTTEEKTKLAGISANASDVGQLYPDSNYGEIFNDYGGNVASGTASHAEGSNTTASGDFSHVEGLFTVSSNAHSHAEGMYTTASGDTSHAEGVYTEASGDFSHAEGDHTTASGRISHAEGWQTIASSQYQHVQGKWNKSDPSGKYAFIIGNGNDTSGIHRSDAFAVDWNGLIYQNNSETGVDLNNKVDKVAGKGLSTNDYTTEEKTKLAGIPGIDTTPTEDSTNLITSGGVYTALQSAGGDNFSVIKKSRTGSGSDVIASGTAKTFSFTIPTMEIGVNVIGIVGAISRTEGIIVAGSSYDGRAGLGTSHKFSFTLYNTMSTSTTIWTADIYILTKS